MKKLLIAFVTLALLSVSALASATEIRVKGSTTVDPAMRKLVAAYQKSNPGINFSISATGSGDGAKAIINKTADIGMMSRPMKDAEIKKCQANGIEPVRQIIALDCIVPIVNPSNPITKITTAQLKDVYQDKISNWKDLGGNDGAIAVFSRETNSGTYEVWEKKVMNKEDEFDMVSRMPSNAAMAAKIAGNKNGIGYVGLGFLNDKIKGLTVNGIVPSVKTGADGTYPLARKLNLYTGGKPSGEVAKFINFVMSDAGQKIIAAVGFVPIN